MERAVTRKVFQTISHPGDSRRLAKEVVDYLAGYIADGDILHDLDIILTEACANVCRHAYGGEPGPLEVRLTVTPGAWIELEIVDWGRGFGSGVRFENPGPDAEGGRGLYIMRMLANDCQVKRRDRENVVFIHKDIGAALWKT
ncbi:ATP-binding protein [Desulfovibrio sp. TomC]|uniref:ATP-binding protein n=1 Tax=Desulfovibrio sp. TomC TaxID=1562888 RepID=UPI0005BC83C7|nr:ATP-binding protein [Desulfovibrio sp. TomC]